MSAIRQEVADLRALLRDKFGGEQAFSGMPREKFTTGVECLDEAGVCSGAIAEVVTGQGSSGVGWLIDSLITTAGQSYHFGLVDGVDCYDPAELATDTKRRFLWVRCRCAEEAVKAAELLVRDGNLPLIVLDLQLGERSETRRIPHGVWYRLRATAESSGAALLVFCAEKLVPCAVTRLVLYQRFSLSVFDQLRTDIELVPTVAKAEPQVVTTEVETDSGIAVRSNILAKAG